MPAATAKQPRSPENAPRILRGDDDTFSVADAALSTENRWPGHEATGDIIEHEQTFERFLSLVAVAVVHIVSCLVALIIGGVEGHWGPAVILVALASIAAVSGAAVRSIGWKPGVTVLALEVIVWLLLA